VGGRGGVGEGLLVDRSWVDFMERNHGLRSGRLRCVQGVKLDGLGVLDSDGGGLGVVGGVHGRWEWDDVGRSVGSLMMGDGTDCGSS
jgi:hypothetical protein